MVRMIRTLRSRRKSLSQVQEMLMALRHQGLFILSKSPWDPARAPFESD